jgi:hypothetical protein
MHPEHRKQLYHEPGEGPACRWCGATHTVRHRDYRNCKMGSPCEKRQQRTLDARLAETGEVWVVQYAEDGTPQWELGRDFIKRLEEAKKRV